MKKIISLFLCFVTLSLTFSFSSAFSASAASEDDGSIVVYNWGEYIPLGDDGGLDVLTDFTEKTGIKVTYMTFASNEEMYTKIKSGSASYDIIIPSDYMISKMIKEDLLLPLDFSHIPNYEYIDKSLLEKFDYDPENKFSVPYTWGSVGLLYNTDVVKEKIDSWQSLWDEKYNNKILMFDNSRDAFAIAQKLLGYSFNSLNEYEWRDTAELLKKQKSVVRSYVMDQIFAMMISGEAAVAPYYVGDALTIMKENENVDFVIPKEGTNLFVDAMCIPKNCKNKAGAEAFINYMCSYEPACAVAEYIAYSSPHTEAAKWHKEYLLNEYGERAVDVTYPENFDGYEVFTDLSPEINRLQTDLWLEVRANSHYTTSVICVFAVMAVLIGATIVSKIRKRRKDKFIYS